MSKQPEKNGVFYDWEESAPTLQQFVNSASSKPETAVGFSFNINLSTDENLKNSWVFFSLFSSFLKKTKKK